MKKRTKIYNGFIAKMRFVLKKSKGFIDSAMLERTRKNYVVKRNATESVHTGGLALN